MSREDLLALAASLQRQVAELIASNEALRAEIEQLKYSDRTQSVAVLENGCARHAFEAFISMVRTLTKEGIDSLVEGLHHLFRSPSIQGVPP